MRLSVIVPVHDVAPYLGACLDSLVMAATRLESKCEKAKSVEIEVICVDDGSTDGSSAILDDWAALLNANRHPLTAKILHQQNAGVSSARNAAMDMASGDWIGFVDADDVVDEHWFCRFCEVLEASSKVDLVYLGKPVSVLDTVCPAVREDKVPSSWLELSEARTKAASVRDRRPRVTCGEDARRRCLHRYARYGWPVSNFVKRDLVGNIRFPTGVNLKEDVCFFVQVGNRVSCIAEVDFPGYFYTRRNGSAVMRHRSDVDSLKFVTAMLALISPNVNLQASNFQRQPSCFLRAISTSIGYEFVQWAEERDPTLPYDAKNCPIRAAWRQASKEGMIDLGDLPFFWRPAIRLWTWTGQLWLAKVTRRTREWMARFI